MGLGKKTIDDQNYCGKKVLVRCDFNVPMKDGVITNDNRINAALPTIKKLIADGAKVILCSHLGKPKNGPEAKFSLAPVAVRLSEKLGQPVTFADDDNVVGENAKAAVATMGNGDVVLLQNTRFRKEETKNMPEFSEELASLADAYVDDAFGSCHRAHCSTAGVTDFIKDTAVGYLMEKEIKYLGNAVNDPERPFTAILGGAKVADKLNVISNLLEKVDTLIIGGGMAYTFLKAQGYEIGKSLCDDSKLDYCKDMMAKAKEKGFTFYVHPEIEFYLFEKQDDWAQTPKPIDEGGYFDHVPRSPGMDFRRATVNMLEQMGISVEYSHHEAGPGQNEIDLRYADALTTADNIMTFRTVVKEISLERGIHASFMPKPLADAPGSGMHTHLSLFEGDANAFYEAGQEFNMSVTARQFAAGILYHAAEICAVTDQYVNSYKRLWGGAEAPSYICWGHNNRSALLRIPQYKPGKGNSARMEFRALDPVANPYLAYSVLLAAGLDGIDKQMQLGEPTSDDVWELTDAERQAMGIQPLPESLDEALKIMEKSDFVADVLGEHAFEYFLRNKHQEWDEYRKQVTPFELKKYLPKL